MFSKVALLLIFLIAFGGQLVLWNVDSFTDEEEWVRRVIYLKEDLPQRIPQFDPERYSGHPGMTSVMPAALLHLAGVAPLTSLRIAVAAVSAVAITGIAFVARAIRKNNLWWIVTTLTILFHPLLLQASPTNAIEAPLIVLTFLLTLLIYERQSISRHHVIALGITMGLITATRLPLGVLTVIGTLVFLLPTIQIRRALQVVLTSVVTFIVIDPLTWFAPVEHVSHMLFRTSLHLNTISTGSIQAYDVLFFAPFTCISLLFALWFLISKKRALPPMYLVYLLSVTIVMLGIFLNAESQSMRYFFPLIFIWEAFLPFFILTMIESIQSFPSFSTKKVFYISVAVLLAASQLILLLFALNIPSGVVITS